MKVGVFAGGEIADPIAGGGSTFQHSLLAALAQFHGSHQFYLFDNVGASKNYYPGLTVIPLQKYVGTRIIDKIMRRIDRVAVARSYKSFLNRAIRTHHIDIMWFISPVYQQVDIPYIYTVWDLQHRLQPYFPEVSVTGSTYAARESHYSNVIPRASYVIIGNQEGKDEVMRFYGVPDNRVKIVPLPTPAFALKNDVHDQSFNARFKVSRPYLFYPAQFWPHKNHVVMLHAIKILHDQHNIDFDIVFTGSDKGNLKYIQEVTAVLGLQDRVHFLGFVTQQELIWLYKNAFALVFPSYFGPDNIPPLEAFGLACPALVADVPGMKLQLGDAALFFDPASEVDLAQKIMLLNSDAGMRNILIQRGLLRAKSFTATHYVQDVVKILDEFAPIRRCWSSNDEYKHT
jgi:glycosyltransferase involved in cell wall biosynthesis